MDQGITLYHAKSVKALLDTLGYAGGDQFDSQIGEEYLCKRKKLML